jgi:hypothetical protein
MRRALKFNRSLDQAGQFLRRGIVRKPGSGQVIMSGKQSITSARRGGDR